MAHLVGQRGRTAAQLHLADGLGRRRVAPSRRAVLPGLGALDGRLHVRALSGADGSIPPILQGAPGQAAGPVAARGGLVPGHGGAPVVPAHRVRLLHALPRPAAPNRPVPYLGCGGATVGRLHRRRRRARVAAAAAEGRRRAAAVGWVRAAGRGGQARGGRARHRQPPQHRALRRARGRTAGLPARLSAALRPTGERAGGEHPAGRRRTAARGARALGRARRRNGPAERRAGAARRGRVSRVPARPYLRPARHGRTGRAPSASQSQRGDRASGRRRRGGCIARRRHQRLRGAG
mmetsp:Transcript_7881/g.25807  ORF Transcript_7881/g.25807 Transcript_7881/m.25807 type:complete len:293 (+) Transcript_7881:723-1601(+)